MRKISLAVILFLGCLQNSFAQTDDASASAGKHEKQCDQYIGVQLNGLIRQVFNFNSSTTSTVVNPYLLTYNINSRKTGWGLRAGIGYNYNSTSSDDGITATTTKVNDLQVRIGIEKAFTLSDKWSAGAGLDGVYNNNNDNTTNMVRSGDTVTTTTKTVGSSYGGGPMAWLRYNITPRILIGTEASFYYVTGKTKNTVDVTDVPFGGGGGGITTTETTSNPKVSQGVFSSPVVFYISVKF